MATYEGFEKYTTVNCEVFAAAGYECDYDDVEFTAKIVPKDNTLKLKDMDGKVETRCIFAFDIKMVYLGGRKCRLAPRMLIGEKRLAKSGKFDELSKVYLKNGENRYVLNLSNVSIESYTDGALGPVEECHSVYLIGPKTVAALKDVVSRNTISLNKAVRIGYHTMPINQTCIVQIRSFLDICERAGIFDQEDFTSYEDGCTVLTKFNDE